MVYRKSNIKVLLGPETLRSDEEVTGRAGGHDEEQFPSRVGLRKPVELFEKIGETNVYKRTRPFQALQGRPKLDRDPSNLQLSGHKVESEDTRLEKLERNRTSAQSGRGVENTPVDDMDRKPPNFIDKAPQTDRDLQLEEARYSPTLLRAKRDRGHSSSNNTISHNFLTEFGLRSERTDTFSGHQRRRGVSADMERQLEMSAERHIRTCQVVGNVKRSSRAQQSYQGLKDTVYPLHSPHVYYQRRQNGASLLRDKSFFRSDLSLDNNDNTIPYMIQIRKNVGSTSRIKALGKPFSTTEAVPRISSRTIIVGTKFG